MKEIENMVGTLDQNKMVHLVLGLLLLFLLTIPLAFAVIRRASRLWLRSGYEGDNKMLEPHEIDKLVAHYIMIGCLFALIFMVIMEPVVDYSYGWHPYVVFGTGMVGAEAHILLSMFRNTKKGGE
jgi:hypothetical protein